ncbi:MAG: hypothetical protein GY835_14475 [bacterium]|nr:hypothetical protein [bacterium]
MIRSVALLLLCLGCLFSLAIAEGYEDENGLPSGTTTLKWITQADIDGLVDVHGFDFATATVDSLQDYNALSDAGIADLVLIEIISAPGAMYLGAPEGGASYDKPHIHSLGSGLLLEDIENTLADNGEPHTFINFEPAEPDFAYLLAHVDSETDTTWVKFLVTDLTATHITFDWVWQPNGDTVFVPPPPAAIPETLSLIKTFFR